MKKKLIALMTVTALCGAMLAGCGDTQSDPAGESGTPSGGGNASDVIKIGVILPFSGASSYVGNAQYAGYEYALEDYMEHYGDQLNGKTIQLVTGDSTGVADTGVSEFERLVNSEQICAAIGTYNSGVAAAVAQQAIRYQIPFMVTNAVADVILAEDSNYVFRTNMGDADAAPSYREFIAYLNEECGAGIENVAIIYEASDFGQGAYDNLTENVYPELGINVVMSESFTANSGDLSTIINKLRVSEADMVCAVMSENDALLFTRQMEEYGLELPILAYGGGFIADNYIEQAGDASNLIMSSASYIYDPSAMSEDALAIAEEFTSTTEYTQMNEAFANGWLGMYTLLEAIGSTGGSTDANEIADALNGFTAEPGDRALLFHPTMEGIVYEDDAGRYNQNTFAGMQFGQIQDGEYKLVFPVGDTTSAVIWPAQ